MLKSEPPPVATRSRWLNPGGRGLGPLVALTAVVLFASSAAATPQSAGHARVSAPDGLNLRDGPSTSANVLTTLPLGTPVDVQGDATSDGWYAASASGRQGFVDGAYLDFSTPAALRGDALVMPADGLFLRSGPSKSAGVMAVLPAGRLVHLMGEPTGDGWYQVQAQEGTGWVDGTYLEASGGDALPVVIRWYGHDFDGGPLACGGIFHADDATVAATNGWPCGTHLSVCAGGKCVNVVVQDRGHMGAGAMDLSAAAFQKLAPLETGVLSGTLQVVQPTAPTQ